MRNTYVHPRNYLTTCVTLCAVFCLLAHCVNAQTTLYWDPTGLTGNAQTSGNWEDSSWATAAAGQAGPGTWSEGDILGLNATVGSSGGTYTITANANHTFAGIINGDGGLNGGNVTINGNASIFTPGNAVLDTGAGASTVINTSITGDAITVQGSGSLSLFGYNTFSEMDLYTTAPIYINNASSLGFNGGVISEYSGTLNLNSTGNSPITLASFLNFGPGNFLNFTGGPNAPVTLSGNLYLPIGNNQLTVNAGSPLTISGSIQSGGYLTKQGAGTLIVTGANQMTGQLTLAGGILKAGTDLALSTGSPLVFAGGTLQVNGHNLSGGALSVTTGGSVIDFGSGNSGGSLMFRNSSGSVISSILDIINFDPSVDSIYVGTDATGLTSAQLADIVIDDGTLGATGITSDGELDLVVPEPSSLVLAAFGGLGMLWVLARRKSN